MLFDLLQLMTLMEIETDLCIFGAGAAGISMAREFLRSPTRVCVFEAGGIEATQEHQRQYAGDSIGELPMEIELSRLRAFGGSTNLWGGGCIPLAPIDFERRDWVPESGWPINYSDMASYYRRAADVCGLESHDFRNGTSNVPPADPLSEFDKTRLDNKLFARSPVIFGGDYHDDLHRAENVRVYLNGSLLRLEADPSGTQITHALVVGPGGRIVRVRAKQFVLACGGLENARLLLQSNTVMPHGLGNEHGNVGRYFQDHPSFSIGSLRSSSGQHVHPSYLRERAFGKAPSFPEIELSEAYQRRERVLGGRVRPFPVYKAAPGLSALRDLRLLLADQKPSERDTVEASVREAMKNTEMYEFARPPDTRTIPHSVLRTLLGAPDLLRAVQRKLADQPIEEVSHVDMIAFFEQAPNAESRVTLGPTADANGQRRIQVDWRLTALDEITYRKAARNFGDTLAAAWGSTFTPAPWVTDPSGRPPRIYGTAHHIGATRMAHSPKDGVVDQECRVHGVANLHVAGSSVFPTGGWAFPTLTIVALSVRLADRLRKVLADAPLANIA
jgi:choline dehydrogenase-like flavoprotein